MAMTWTSAQLRRLSLWLMCAMLLAALAPTVSRARAWSQGSAVPWMEVCTANGTQQIAATTATPLPAEPDSPSGQTRVDHCALCVLASDRLAPPPAPIAWQVRPQAPPLWVALTDRASSSVLHWTVRSRAPPAHA